MLVNAFKGRKKKDIEIYLNLKIWLKIHKRLGEIRKQAKENGSLQALISISQESCQELKQDGFMLFVRKLESRYKNF